MDEARLAALPLFASLSKADRATLSRFTNTMEVPEGTELVREGEFSYEFFVIERGRAQVSRDDQVIAELGPGDFMGEMGLLGGVQRNATVTALSQMTVIVMSGQEFRSVSAELPGVAEEIRGACRERASVIGITE